jgi:hypothetical protein
MQARISWILQAILFPKSVGTREELVCRKNQLLPSFLFPAILHSHSSSRRLCLFKPNLRGKTVTLDLFDKFGLWFPLREMGDLYDELTFINETLEIIFRLIQLPAFFGAMDYANAAACLKAPGDYLVPNDFLFCAYLER